MERKEGLHHLSLKINLLFSLSVLPCTLIFISSLCFFFFSQLGKVYFDLQPLWFDTPSSNGRCFKVENFPVTAKDLEAMKYVKSNSKAFTEQAKGNGNLLISIPLQSTSARKQCSSYESQNRWMFRIDNMFFHASALTF